MADGQGRIVRLSFDQARGRKGFGRRVVNEFARRTPFQDARGPRADRHALDERIGSLPLLVTSRAKGGVCFCGAPVGMAMLSRRRAGQPAGTLAWIALLAGAATGIAANVAAAEPTFTGRAVAAWPPIALALAY